MLVGNKLTEDNKIISIRDWEKDAKYKEVCMREGLQYWNFLSAFDLHEKKEFKEADIIHFHNLHGDYFNYLSLPSLTRLKPSVGPYMICSHLPGTVLSLTAVKSGKRDAETEVFHPLKKSWVRKKLNIPQEKKVFLTSASGGSKNPQKGAEYLLEALSRIQNKEGIVFISLGEKNSVPLMEGLHWINAGHIYNEKELAEWYSAADIFLYPSIADNCPLVVLEAMASALPVITFDTGGIPEMLRHIETGYVARLRDVDDFLKGMRLFINDGELRESAGSRARAAVEKSFTVEQMVNSYLNLYYEILERENHKVSKSSAIN